MLFQHWDRSSAAPDLTVQIADALNGLEVPGGRIEITPDRVQVLRQKVAANRPQLIPGAPAVASVASCLALLHGVPPRGGHGLALFLAFQPCPDADWHIAGFQALSLLERPPVPFATTCVINSYIAMGFGVYVYDGHEGAVAILRAELADGTILDEDPVLGRGLLVHLPVHSPSGWSEEEAPLIRLLDARGNDILPPARIPLQCRIRPDRAGEG